MSKIQNCIILSDELSEELWHLTQSILNNVVDYFTNNWLSPKPFDSNFTFPNGISRMIWPLSSSICIEYCTVPWFTLSLPDFRPTEDPKGCYSYLINKLLSPKPFQVHFSFRHTPNHPLPYTTDHSLFYHCHSLLLIPADRGAWTIFPILTTTVSQRSWFQV